MEDKLIDKLFDVFDKKPHLSWFLASLALIILGSSNFKSTGGLQFEITNPILQGFLVGIGGVIFIYQLYIFLKNFDKYKVDTEPSATNAETTGIYHTLASQIAIDKFHYLCMIEEKKGYKILAESHMINSQLDVADKFKNLINGKYEDKLKQYRTYSIKMVRTAIDFDDKLDKEISQGDVIRLVFDVKEGGVFYGKIHLITDKSEQKRYIFGATLEQSSMDICTQLFGELIDTFRQKEGRNKIINTVQ